MGRFAAALVALAGLALAPSASADTAKSSNWAGYAVHRGGISFRSIKAQWREPAVSCGARARTFSSYWVGLGGFNSSSQDIEQIGTEADCTRFGSAKYTAWYELLPAPSSPISLAVHSGDLVAASVTVHGHIVTFRLSDLTTGRRFGRTIPVGSVDVSSAEWIVEAPSDCLSANECVTLPLADFGSASFLDALAQGSRGHWGTISHPGWARTKITLAPGAQRFISASGAAAGSGGADPGPLTTGGEAFDVSYSATDGAGRTPSANRPAIRLGPLVHRGR